MPGLWFDDLEIGMSVRHYTTRTVTEADNVFFSCLTMNPQPLHLDANFASTTEFGRPIVNSLFTLGLVVGIAVPELTLGTTVANLGFEEIRFPAPVHHGDTISAETEISGLRPSRSRPNDGIATFVHRGWNQHTQLVCEARRVALMRRRPTVGNEQG